MTPLSPRRPGARRVRGRPEPLFRRPVSQKPCRDVADNPRLRKKQHVVLARYARNKRLADVCCLWAFAAITASPGCRDFYDRRRANGDTHNRALRALANGLVGILHGCLHHDTLYDEHIVWGHRNSIAA